MRTTIQYLLGVLLITICISVLVACGSSDSPSSNTPDQIITSIDPALPQFDDIFAYCQAMELLNQPEHNYTGESLPNIVAEALQQILSQANQLPTTWDPGRISWRCMANSVYACFPQNNLECNVKLNFSRKATPEVQAYCQQNPNSIKIPESVVLQKSPYHWHCDGNSPMIKSQRFNADQAGFNSAMWFLIESPPET